MIFYTSITNGYDKLSSPPEVDARFVCFYDGDKPETDGWEYIKPVSYTRLTLPTNREV